MRKKYTTNRLTPVFKSNYPASDYGRVTLLPTPERINAHPDYDGAGVTVAFIDSGFYAHPDLKGRILTHINATTADIDESPRVLKSQMFSWHGQMTTFICAGDGARSNGRWRGVAPQAKLVLIKIADPQNRVKEPDIERGLRWVLLNHERYGIRIVNLSVGGDHVSYDPYHPLHRLVRELTDAGVAVVAASGNHHADHVVPPASSATAITVGGVDDNNTLNRAEWTLYSHNIGMGYDGSIKPDVLAPARWLASPILPATRVAQEAFWLGALLAGDADHPVRRLLREGRADAVMERLFGDRFTPHLHDTLQERIFMQKIIDPYHQHVDGTSISAPVVSGVCAQMLEANPRLTPHDLREILQQTAQVLPHLPTERQGHGVLNARAAVEEALRRR